MYVWTDKKMMIGLDNFEDWKPWNPMKLNDKKNN